jgi:putative zinc finger protein
MEIGKWNSTMKCNQIQQSLSLYVDDGLTAETRSSCYQHMEVCPVCREHVVELRKLRSGLALLSKPEPPADLVPAINLAIVAEAARQKARRQASAIDLVNDWALKWLQPRPMRYAFSSLASIIIFTAVFAALRPHMIALHEATVAFEQLQIMPSPSDELDILAYDINKPISPESYVALRNPYNSQSPSLDPRGALATLGSQINHLTDRESDDDMVIVADVFLNGSASLANVMHAPRDRRMLADFEQALRTNAAFVPAAMDRRPETMRVVFSVQRVDVKESNY